MSETYAQYHICPDGSDCPICGNKSPVHLIMGPQEYLPETKTVRKDHIYSAIDCVENGLEYARECLATHEISLGRTTLKNRLWAEHIENDIRKMEKLLVELKGL